MTSRREFLSTGLAGLTRKSGRLITGGFVNETQVSGHALRDHRLFPAVKRRERFPVIIVGGGIAGLSAAWQLQRRGLHDFVLLEMEPEAGGNSRWGENEVTAYPWGAHYVPVPGPNLTLVRELMQDFGVLHDDRWEERWLCHSPQERVYIHGRWQEGFEPETRTEREEWHRFHERMKDFAQSGDFSIPVPSRSRLHDLDHIPMSKWLADAGFTSRYLRWYVDYACRDDFGAHPADVSAWMGVHYFSSREPDERGPLTWPEGNGWIARRLVQRLERHIRRRQPVIRITPKKRGFEILTPDTSLDTDFVIFAAPSFVLPFVLNGVPALRRTYSPWVTANLTLDRPPRERGAEPAWDNVIADSPSLGYVIATHMNLRTHNERTVWTWYHALADSDTRAARTNLLTSKWEDWKEFILTDLSRAHPDIRECVSKVDVMRFGHAMARPVPGSLFTADAPRLPPHIALANSDVSGYSIFEEAQYRGVQAANRALNLIGGSPRELPAR